MQQLPGSRGCYVCGRENPVSLRMIFFLEDSGEVTSEIVVSEDYAGYPGIVHGGNVAAMLDEAAGRAATTDNPNRFAVTSRLAVRYRQPVPTNQLLKVTGRFIKKRGKVSQVYSEIRNEAGELLAEADGVFVDIAEDFTQGENPERLGWKVYQNE